MRSSHGIRRVVSVLFLLVSTMMTLPTGLAHAATLHVTTCNGSGPGSLPALVAVAAGDTIVFDLDCPLGNPIRLSSTIAITRNVAIDGSGHTIVVSGNHAVGAFAITASIVGPSVEVRINALTIRDSANQSGAAIVNQGGILTLTYSTVSNNDTHGIATMAARRLAR